MASGIIRMDDGWRLDEGHQFDLPPYVPPPATPPVPVPKPKGKAMDIIPPQTRRALPLAQESER